MCYRNSNTKEEDIIEERFNARFYNPNVHKPYYHFAGHETKFLAIIKQNEFYGIENSYWGLMPDDMGISERKDFLSRYATFNARGEDLFKSRLYSRYAMNQRCLIIADGFYEPHKVNGKSIPHYCRLKDHSLFAFAGLYTQLDDDIFTASIVTTIANPFFKKIHNVKKKGTYRMPLVLDESEEDEWLNSDLREGDVEELIYTFTSKQFEAYSVSKDVDLKVEADREDILNPVSYPELTDLFS